MKQYPLDLKFDHSETSNTSTAFILVVLATPVVIILAMISHYAWMYN
ncbi:MAG: hypothetical protein QF399_00235 [Gammaproteobacteria bacterium]|nr:hypothetical protein [Gammaproteobacteria bacterium]